MYKDKGVRHHSSCFAKLISVKAQYGFLFENAIYMCMHLYKKKNVFNPDHYI